MEYRDDKAILNLCHRIRPTSFQLHVCRLHGHLEKVYENGLAHRPRKEELIVEQQIPPQIHDEDGTVLGDCFADLPVEKCLIVEWKACPTLADEHTAQVLGYLHATHLHDAMLINFGSPRLPIRKFFI